MTTNQFIFRLRFVIIKSATFERLTAIPLPAQLLSAAEKLIDNVTSEMQEKAKPHNLHFIYSFSYFGDFASLLTTSVIEYSVIGAAMMMAIWKSIGVGCRYQVAGVYAGQEKIVKRKSKIVVDCRYRDIGIYSISSYSFMLNHAAHQALASSPDCSL